MAMLGTLEKVLEKLYELYMEERINENSAMRYLGLLKHPNGEFVFDKEDIDKLLKILKKDKEHE